jgi:hypothetical protein
MPDVKCIAWKFNGSNFVSYNDWKRELNKLRFENGKAVPEVWNYFKDVMMR